MRDRAANLALAVASAVAELQSGHDARVEAVHRAHLDLAALVELCGVADVALPPSGGEKGSPERRAWHGWAPPQDDAQEAAALACWAALGESVDAVIPTWRAAIANELRRRTMQHTIALA